MGSPPVSTPSRPAGRWMGIVPVPALLRAWALQLLRRLEPLTHGPRWVISALFIGLAPLGFSLLTGLPGHQLISGILLSLVCLSLAHRDRWGAGLGALALAYLSHSIVAIAASAIDPATTSAIFPDAASYWAKQQVWIRTGQDPEYELINWVPAYIQLLIGATLFSYTSFGGLIFIQGFYEVDLMNF
ncbi:MAG: hypothetical protein AAFS10_26110 [Myxococcota bacterium]